MDLWYNRGNVKGRDARYIRPMSHKGKFMTTSDDTTIPLKRCTKCGEEKPAISEFFRVRKDKLISQCKDCERYFNSERRKTPEFKEKENERRRIRYSNDPEYREARKQENERWKSENHEQYSKIQRINYEKNREKRLEYARNQRNKPGYRERYAGYMRARYHKNTKRKSYLRNWRVKNIQKSRLYGHNYRSRERDLPYTLTSTEWQICLQYFENRCSICGKTEDLWTVISADHWIPIASEDCPGTTVLNIVPICHSKNGGIGGCNNSKRHKLAGQWLVEKFGKNKAAKILKRIQGYFEWVKQRG